MSLLSGDVRVVVPHPSWLKLWLVDYPVMAAQWCWRSAQRHPKLWAGSVVSGFFCVLLDMSPGYLLYGLPLLGLWWLAATVGRLTDRLPRTQRWFARFVAVPWREARRRRRYERKWAAIMHENGLASRLPGELDAIPRIVRVRCREWGDEVLVEPLISQVPRTYRERAEELADDLGARQLRVHKHVVPRRWWHRARKPPAGLLRLEFAYGRSPLEVVRPHPGIREDVDLSAIALGVVESGQALTVPILGKHWLVAGITGAGKSSAMWGLILALAPLVRDGRVKIWAIDGKGGLELWRGWQDGAGLFHRYCDGGPDEASELLGEFVALMDERSHLLKRDPSRKLEEPTVEFPLHVLLVDELARVVGKQESRDLEKQLHIQVRDAINVGRAVGFSFCGFLQSPTLENMAHRNEVPVKMALRLEGEGRTDLILGSGAERAGFRCHEIDAELPGVGYGRFGVGGEIVAFRLFYPTDAQIADAVREFSPFSEPQPV